MVLGFLRRSSLPIVNAALLARTRREKSSESD
jgi:hypothetical protein